MAKINKKHINLDYSDPDALSADNIPYDENTYLSELISLQGTNELAGLNVDWLVGSVFTKSISSNETFTFSNIKQGQEIVLIITSSSNAKLTLPGSVTSINGGEFVANKTNIIKIKAVNSSSLQYAYFGVDDDFFKLFPTSNGSIGALDVDWSQNKVFTKSISSNETFTFSNVKQGQEIVLDITSSSGAILTLPASVNILSGSFNVDDRNIIKILANNSATEQLAWIYNSSSEPITYT